MSDADACVIVASFTVAIEGLTKLIFSLGLGTDYEGLSRVK